jgi:ubiquitin-activating enzyme E1
MEDKIDTDLYSRQIGTFGMNIMGKLLQLKVLIVGMRGLGIETAKNIILSGSYSVDIHDPTIVKINDLGSNFYLKEEDVNNKNRDEASLENLSQLNSYVKVSVLKLNSKKGTKEYMDEFCENITNYNIIVFTEICSKDFLIKVDEECRKKNVKLIYGVCFGLTGGIFTDFGPNHIIIDDDGEEAKSYFVTSISKDEEGLVTIDTIQGTEKFSLGDGDFVKFKNVEGMTELNDENKDFEIMVEDTKSFRIGDTSKFGEYTKGGVVYQIKKPKIIKYEDYKKRSEIMWDDNSKLYCVDYTKNGRQLLLFVTFGILQEYYSLHEYKLPELNNKEQANELVKQIKKGMRKLEKKKNIKNILQLNLMKKLYLTLSDGPPLIYAQ